MVKQWQDMNYDGRHSSISYEDSLPDFSKLVESYGHVGIKITKNSELKQKIEEAFSINDRLVFVDENGIDLGVPTDTSMMIYNWQRYSYIPFHSDTHCKIGATLFLNPFWKKNWGGAQIYVDNDRHYLEYPEFNKMCVHYTDDNDEIGHSTTMTHPGAPDRLTVQMFFRYN